MAEENIEEGFENLTGTEKSAILMMLLGKMKPLLCYKNLHQEKFSTLAQRCIQSLV